MNTLFPTITPASSSRSLNSHFLTALVAPHSFDFPRAPDHGPLTGPSSIMATLPSTSVDTSELASNSEEDAYEQNALSTFDLWPAALHSDMLSEPLYKPTGKWEWLSGLPIRDSESISLISSGRHFSIHMKTGLVGDQRINYLCKSWRRPISGLFRELALHQVQLKPLQGNVVPIIIGVYSNAEGVSIVMEPPHHSFWIEASSDMPYLLKRRCVEAFEKIHATGIYHSDVKLGNMLIGGDGQVSIINFQDSRVLVPNASIQLESTTPADLQMEMRKVKLQLDFEDARKKEYVKWSRSLSQPLGVAGPSKRVYRHPEEPDDPVINIDQWLSFSNAPPRRFIIPEQTTADLETEIWCFLHMLDCIDVEEHQPAHNVFSSPSTNTHPVSDPNVPTIAPAKTVTTRRYDLRSHTEPSIIPIDPQAEHGYIPRSCRKRVGIDRKELDTRPAKKPRFCIQTPDFTGNLSLSTRNTFGGSGDLIDAGIIKFNHKPRLPPIHVRDFAYEPQSSSLRQCIIDANIRRCINLGLPHPDALKVDPDNPRWKDPDILEYIRLHNNQAEGAAELIRRYPNIPIKIPRPRRSEGSLKRAMAKITSARRIQEGVTSRKRKRELEGSDDQPSTLPDTHEGPKIRKLEEAYFHEQRNARYGSIWKNPGSKISGVMAKNTLGIRNSSDTTISFFTRNSLHGDGNLNANLASPQSPHAPGTHVTSVFRDAGRRNKLVSLPTAGMSPRVPTLYPQRSEAVGTGTRTRTRLARAGITLVPPETQIIQQAAYQKEERLTTRFINNLNVTTVVAPPYAGLLTRCMGSLLRLFREVPSS